MNTIFFSAGEVSGDIHGSYIARALFQVNPSLNIVGMGSRNMKAVGVNVLWDIIEFSSIGFIESLIPAIKIYSVLQKIKKYLRDQKIDLLFLIDNQGVNIPLARMGKDLNIPVYYYFPPQVSIWGSWNAKKISGLTSKILIPFMDDYLVYKNVSNKAYYVGHPLPEIIQKKLDENIIKKKSTEQEIFTIGLFPGSRTREIKSLLPVMLDSSEMLSNDVKIKILLPLSSIYFRDIIQKILFRFKKLDIEVIEHGDYTKYQECDFAIACSGTVTLELAILNIPMIVVYKLNLITYLIAKYLVKKRYISLPNILLGEYLVPELIQKNASPRLIYENVMNTYFDKHKLSIFKLKLKGITKYLGDGNTIQQVVDHIQIKI